MKRIIQMVVMILLLIPNYGFSNESEKFILKGEFINANKVRCHIYKDLSVNHDSWTLITQRMFENIYEIELDINSFYLLVFEDATHDKCLYIFTKKADDLVINTDFSNRNAGLIIFDKDFDVYKMKIIPADEMDSMQKEHDQKEKEKSKKKTPIIEPKKEYENIPGWG